MNLRRGGGFRSGGASVHKTERWDSLDGSATQLLGKVYRRPHDADAARDC